MKITEIAFVGYAVTDIKRARHFYEDILGLKAASVWEGEGMAFIEYVFGAKGEYAVCIGKGVEIFKPGTQGGYAAFEVDDFDGAMKAVRDNKCKIVMEPYESSACHMAVVADPDGNLVMIHRRKQAK